MSVYFLGDLVCGAIKIGYTGEDNPLKRTSSIQTSSPHDLHVIGVIDGDKSTEAELHFMLDAYRIRGEWFRPHDRVVETIRNLLLDEHGAAAQEMLCNLRQTVDVDA